MPDKLQEHCQFTWLRGFLAVAFNFGMRKGELLGLKVGQVNFEERRIELLPGTTKNDKGRAVVMTVEVVHDLKPCAAGKKPSEALFTWNDGSPVKDFRTTWKNLCATADVPILVHDFRRSAIRNMVRGPGISERTAMRISGHQTRAVFDRYNIDADEDLVDAAIKLEELNERNSGINRKLLTEDEETS
jgi:integrase